MSAETKRVIPEDVAIPLFLQLTVALRDRAISDAGEASADALCLLFLANLFMQAPEMMYRLCDAVNGDSGPAPVESVIAAIRRALEDAGYD